MSCGAVSCAEVENILTNVAVVMFHAVPSVYSFTSSPELQLMYIFVPLEPINKPVGDVS
jgi:hypothetical protein